MRRLLILLGALALVSSCTPRPATAVAVLRPTRGNGTAGVVIFRQAGADLVIKGDFTGLAPGAHGLHIRTVGDCSGRNAANAGPIFNPFHRRHGQPGVSSGQLGALPMVAAGKNGRARFWARMSRLSLESGPGNILGRSIVVTLRPDDFTTQPDGRSGAPVACGVIKAE